MIARLCLACVHFVYVFLAVCVVIFNFIAIAVRVVYNIIRNLARFLVCHLIAVVTLRGLVLRYCRIADTSLSPRIADSSLYCEFVIELWVRRRRHIAGSSPYCGFVAVLRVRRCRRRRRTAGSLSSSYCGFVAVTILRVHRCRQIAGSSLSPYCGFIALLRICHHIASSSPYYGFVIVTVLWVRCRRRIRLHLYYRIAGSMQVRRNRHVVCFLNCVVL